MRSLQNIKVTIVTIAFVVMLLVAPKTVDSFQTQGSLSLNHRKASNLLLASSKDDNNKDDSVDGSLIEPDANDFKRRSLITNALGLGLIGVSAVGSGQMFVSSAYTPGFQRIYPIQFIAALGDPKASSGTGAQEWGIWTVDPGPRGVWLRNYESQLVKSNGNAPAGWKFDKNDWWLEEHGLIMEAPDFPLTPGRYLVTGGRKVTTGLTVNKDGTWALDDNAALFDVTHLPCRSARYTPSPNGNGSPLTAKESDFPVTPGAEMPAVEGCSKQDYAVLFVVGKAA